jgi:hypothetical protein
MKQSARGIYAPRIGVRTSSRRGRKSRSGSKLRKLSGNTSVRNGGGVMPETLGAHTSSSKPKSATTGLTQLIHLDTHVFSPAVGN